MQPFFLPVGDSRRFCLYHPARSGSARGAVIYIHPFAEEMNKSRRMAALQSRALAEAGFAVLQIDMLGCGDSSGDFGDASWQFWKQDLLAGYRWLRTQSDAPLTLWGLRAGCLLAAEVAADLPEGADYVFWQPVVSGSVHWQQFMRLKMAAALAGGQSKGVSESLRQALAAGESVEIAGYTVAPALAAGLDRADLLPPARSGCVAWLELSTREDATLAPVSQKRIEQWLGAGFSVESRVVHGPAFWQTAEIEDAPELIASTREILESWR